jgi:hypothetical protein
MIVSPCFNNFLISNSFERVLTVWFALKSELLSLSSDYIILVTKYSQ